MMRRILSTVTLSTVVAAALLQVAPGTETQVQAQAARPAPMPVPVFEVDASWPTLPNNWVMGQVPGIAVDRRDHVFVLHRPRTVPEADRNRAAPAVLEFDEKGAFVKAWGGPGNGYDWPDSEHGIFVDHKDNVWVGGSSPTSQSLTQRSDDMLVKFSKDGRFLLQIGGPDKSKGNADTSSVMRPADAFVYAKTNELFVADGYGNRRIVVFDAESGKFKRMWGGTGDAPIDPPAAPARAGGPAPAAASPAPAGRAGGAAAGRCGPVLANAPATLPRQFGGPVHGVKVSNDGLVYVADRANRRVQVFTTDGKFQTEVAINGSGPASGSAAGVALSPDQRFLYVADNGNSRVLVLDRKSLQVLYQWGTHSSAAGDLRCPHHLQVDSQGNLFVVEVVPGNRAQRFLFKGMSNTLPPNALTAEQLSAPQTPATTAAPSPAPAGRGAAAPGTAAVPAAAQTAGRAGGAPGGRGAPPVETHPWASTISNPYRMVEKWPEPLPVTMGAAIGIIPDGKGGTWIHHRSEPPIIHFDASGKKVTSFADKMFVQAHGFCRDRDGNFWAGDSGPFADNPSTAGRGFQLFKFSPEGKVLLTLGKAGVSKADRADTFIGPTACAIAPNGDIIVADGHWPRPTTAQQDGDRLVRITPQGQFVGEYGKLGSGPGEFMGPHGLAFDSQGRLFVADRSNNRVQILGRDMKFVDEWRHYGRPSGVAILRDDTLVVSDSESSKVIGGPPQAPEGGGNALRNPGHRRGIWVGNARNGTIQHFISGTDPEGLAADELGNIFGGLTGNCQASPSGHCLQKFVRK